MGSRSAWPAPHAFRALAFDIADPVGDGGVLGVGDIDARARSTGLLFGAAALGSSSLNAAFIVAPLAAATMTGSRAWSGIPGAASIAGTALGALVLTKIMARSGRGAGLRVGYALATAGALAAIVAADAGSFVLLVVGMIAMGIGHAGTQLARFAAAEMHPPARRAQVLGWIVWASTIGALLGPLLPEPAQGLSARFGAPGDASGLFIALVFFAFALAVSAMLRPDPSTLVAGDGDIGGDDATVSFRAMSRLPHVRLALVAMLSAQAAMVLVMTVTPLHVREGGHDIGTVGFVMSAHFVGMFAFAPLAGRLVAGIGSKAVMVIGSVLLAGAAAAAGATTGAHSPAVAAGLFALGVGWSLTFVAGSALLTSGLTYRARLKVQGNVDALAWTAAAIASASSGLTFARAGFDVLSYAGVVIGLLPVAVLGASAARGQAAKVG